MKKRVERWQIVAGCDWALVLFWFLFFASVVVARLW